MQPTADSDLILRNLAVEHKLLERAETFYRQSDPRWFFSLAHGMITQQINRHIAAFVHPNALLRLNTHFAETYLRAIEGTPHCEWVSVFRRCDAMSSRGAQREVQRGEARLAPLIAGRLMAKVHISVDLRSALREVGCIPPADFGNMLALMDRGISAGLERLREHSGYRVAGVLGRLVVLDVQAWRNAAYRSVCQTSVPGVSKAFRQCIQERLDTETASLIPYELDTHDTP